MPTTELFDLSEENELQTPLQQEELKVFLPHTQRATQPVIVGNSAPQMVSVPRATLDALRNQSVKYNNVANERDKLAELVRRCMYMLRDMTGSPEDLQEVMDYVMLKVKNGDLTQAGILKDFVPRILGGSGITPPTESFWNMTSGIVNTKAWNGFQYENYLQVCEDNQIPIGDLLPTIVNLMHQMEALKKDK